MPVGHLKKVYGKSVMAETIERDGARHQCQDFHTERGFKLATEPKVTLPTEEAEIERMLTGKADLSYTVAIEVVPPITLGRFQDLQDREAHGPTSPMPKSTMP